jgi:hypothetical protein
MQDVKIFAVGAAADAAAAATRGRSGGATATGGRSGSNSGGEGGTYGHAGAPRMLLVGSRSSGVSICAFVPVSKYFCTSKASEHLVCQARACSADTYRLYIYIYCAATATVEQLSTASVAGRVQRNEAIFSREDIYVDIC